MDPRDLREDRMTEPGTAKVAQTQTVAASPDEGAGEVGPDESAPDEASEPGERSARVAESVRDGTGRMGVALFDLPSTAVAPGSALSVANETFSTTPTPCARANVAPVRVRAHHGR